MASETDPSLIVEQQESISTAYRSSATERGGKSRFLLREIFIIPMTKLLKFWEKAVPIAVKSSAALRAKIHFEPDQRPSISVAEVQIKEFVDSLLQGNTNKCWSC